PRGGPGAATVAALSSQASISNRIDDEVSQLPKDGAILAVASSSTEPAPARAPGDDGAGTQLARVRRTGIETPGVKRPLGAHTLVRVGSAARLAPFLFRARQPSASPLSPATRPER